MERSLATIYAAFSGQFLRKMHPETACLRDACVQDFLVMPAEMPAPKAAPVATPSKYQAPAAVSAAVIRERRKAADARSRISVKSGITVAAPPIQPGLVEINYAQVRPLPQQTETPPACYADSGAAPALPLTFRGADLPSTKKLFYCCAGPIYLCTTSLRIYGTGLNPSYDWCRCYELKDH